MVKIRPDEISSIIRQQIEQYNLEVKVVNVGTVFQVGDGIARIYGLEKVMAGELLEFEDGTVGIALNLESKNVGAVLMGEGLAVQEGSSVKATGKIAQIPVSDGYLGRVVNSLAKPIDGKGEISSSETRLIESGAPGIISRRSVYEPLQTGLLAIDAMIPIGRGQRELIIGDRQTGKTAVAVDTILNQKGERCSLRLRSDWSKSLIYCPSSQHVTGTWSNGLHRDCSSSSRLSCNVAVSCSLHRCCYCRVLYVQWPSHIGHL